MSRGGVFFNFSCGSKVTHETIAQKRDRDLRSGRSLGTRYVASLLLGCACRPKCGNLRC